ncbi:phospholipase A2 inhibitor 25 kDa subunit-like isoform X2 [Ambystoma mexicanum]|uniref:phospholipase A2 inhibitor 25 kDa subunit-like isoform X2 n=1 Tax=Ambystoma mexicanum TaxID=8296 RepID=UPI0037E9AA56
MHCSVFQGYSLKCQKCTSDTDSSCTGPSETCAASDNVCVSTYSGYIGSTEVQRSCGKSNICNVAYSLTTLMLPIERSFTCCNIGNCTPATPVLATINDRANGHTCDSCFSILSMAMTCETDMTSACAGQQTTCFNYVETKSEGNSIMSGCATQSACGLSYGNVTITCSKSDAGKDPNGGAHLQQSHLFLFFAGILLLCLS